MQAEKQNITLPPGTPEWITPELAQETIDVWQPYYEEVLTSLLAVEILKNIGNLFGTVGKN